MANAVTIQLAVTGASNVLETFNRVGRAANSLEENVSKQRAAFLAAGGATATFATAALASYESMERLKRVLAATVGEAKGGQLAEQIKAVAQAANSSGDMLRQFAMNWVGMVQGGEESVIRMMKALDKMGGGLTAEGRMRAAYQLAQIGATPTAQWEDLKELVQSGLPLAGTAKRLGLSTIREASGMDSRKFLAAFVAEAESQPALAPLPTTAIANAAEKFLNSLAPTGERLAAALLPLVESANKFLDWFEKVNTDGKLGFNLLVSGAIATAGHLAAFGLAVQAATFNLSQMSLAAGANAAAAGGLGAGLGKASSAVGTFALALDAALIGWQIGTAVSNWLDKQAQGSGYDNAGDWWAHNNPLSPTSYAIRDAERIAAAQASRENAIEMGYSESDADKIAGVVSRMQSGRRAHKRSDLQNMSANAVASAARAF